MSGGESWEPRCRTWRIESGRRGGVRGVLEGRGGGTGEAVLDRAPRRPPACRLSRKYHEPPAVLRGRAYIRRRAISRDAGGGGRSRRRRLLDDSARVPLATRREGVCAGLLRAPSLQARVASL